MLTKTLLLAIVIGYAYVVIASKIPRARALFLYVILMHAVIISWADGRVERARRVEIPPCIGKSWKRPSYKLSEPHRLHETEHIPTDTRTRRDHGHV